MNTAVDIALLLDNGRWTPYQRFLTAISALAVVFDGFDIQVLGFVIPPLMREWGLPRPAFGPVLAVGLAGMVAGSPAAGYLGDRFGRRPALIICPTLFAGATLATSFVNSIFALGVLRFITGLGTGGALPNASALVAEFAPHRNRPMAVKVTLVCVPPGGMLGGVLAGSVLPTPGWRALYRLGGIAPLLFAAVLWFVLPESPRFLAQEARNWPAPERLPRRMDRIVAPGSRFQDTGETHVWDRASIRALLGPGAYWGTLAVSMVIAFAGLAWIRGHFHAIAFAETSQRSAP